MARTKASVGSKVSSGKSSKARCSVATAPVSNGGSGSSDRASKSNSGGNPVCPRDTPKWQEPITRFFIQKDGKQSQAQDSDEESGDKAAGTSKSKTKKNIIESDDDEILTETLTNKELDDTIELEPLSGENSHKIEEYYPKGGKGKGVGKKTKGKENKRDSKREREMDDVENVSKKIKVN